MRFIEENPPAAASGGLREISEAPNENEDAGKMDDGCSLDLLIVPNFIILHYNSATGFPQKPNLLFCFRLR